MKSKLLNNHGFNKWIKDFYNNKAKNITRGDYEYFRWFSNKKKIRQYEQTIRSLNFHLRNMEFKDCLDVGCGPGTWTFLLLNKYKEARFTCLDISKEMILQFKKRINESRISFIVSSFIDYDIKKTYDFIFCSRSIDYMENKPLVIKRMYQSLCNGGKGMIITSPPHPKLLKIKKIFGKEINLQHTERISAKEMKALLNENRFINIEFFPILFTDYLPETINKFFFNNFYKRQLNLISKIFTSSYIVKFEKP